MLGRGEDIKNARILIVDDEEVNCLLLERILQPAGFTLTKRVTDSRQVLPVFVEYQPDLILLDLHMPFFNGFDVMKQLLPRIPRQSYLPILVLTADANPEVKRRALADGATDFLTKPFDASEVVLRIRNLLSTRSLHLQLQQQNEHLEEKVRERTLELEAAQVEILERLAVAAEYRDDATGEHARRVGDLSRRVAQTLGLGEDQAEMLGWAATLHDVGKIGIPDQILLKPGRLTPAEFDIIRTHTTIGARILSGSRFPLLQMAEEIALTHHERWDGNGYLGLIGDAIPLVGRIVALADAYDAMTHERPYKKALPPEEAMAEVRRQSGFHFDPRVVEAFLQTAAPAAPVGDPAPPVVAGMAATAGDMNIPESALRVLTEREREILRLVADGYNNQEIAQRLYLSVATVKTHVSNILQKLELPDRTKLAVYLLKGGRT